MNTSRVADALASAALCAEVRLPDCKSAVAAQVGLLLRGCHIVK
jgi:hypothetical protein